MRPDKDPMGSAIADYYLTGEKSSIKVFSDLSGEEEIPVEYLFRTLPTMPEREKIALDNCKGKILDVGAGSGCHSIILQEKGYDITAIDISQLSVDVMSRRGLRKSECINIFDLNNRRFDTILMLMNGTGICASLTGLNSFLNHAKNLLNPSGQIIIDSSDIEYLYFEEDGSYCIDLTKEYYGVVRYSMQYRGIEGDCFDWLFVDSGTLKDIAEKNGFIFELLTIDEDFCYLARLMLPA